MNNKNLYKVLLMVGLMLLAFTSYGGESVRSIVKKANHVAFYQGKDGRAKFSVTITDSQGRKRYRKLTLLRKNMSSHDGDQKYYAYFHRPADIRKTVFLVWKHLTKADYRWLYLPALDLVKRIAASDKRTSFVGTDFFYEDISGRRITDDHHKLIKTSNNYYVLKNTPKDPGSVEFSYYNMWIHRKTFVVVKTEYYDKNGKKYRVYESLKVQTIQGYPTVIKSRMKDLRSNNETIAVVTNVKYNIGLPKDIFTERYLKRPPMKYIK